MISLTTFHLYHHMPDPLPPELVTDGRWLCNNALIYSMVALVKAQNQQEAVQAARNHVAEQTLPRHAVVQAGTLLRDTLPGDVLVTAKKAWMVQTNGTLHPLSYASDTPRVWLKEDYAVADLSWSPDGCLLLAAEQSHRVVVHAWDQEEKYPRGYNRDENATYCVAWSPHGGRAASGGYHGEVHLWTPTPWRNEAHVGSFLVCCTEEEHSRRSPITSLTWSPDGVLIFAGRQDGQVVVWDARTGAFRHQVERHTQAVTALAFAPLQEHLLLSAGRDGLIRIWDVHLDQEMQQYQHTKAVTAAVWSPESRLVASSEQDDSALHLWNPANGRLLDRLPLSVSTTRPPSALSLAWSPDGQWLAAGCDDGTLQLFEMATGRQVLVYRAGTEESGEILALEWSPDGQWLASAGKGRYGNAMATKIWAIRHDLAGAERQKP